MVSSTEVSLLVVQNHSSGMKESRNTLAMIQNKIIHGGVSLWVFFIIILLVVSIPLSEFGMSVSQFLLFGFWIFEGADFSFASRTENQKLKNYLKALSDNLRGKFRMVISNHVLLVFLAIYVMHLIGLFYSADLNYALNDLRVKLPLLSLPILLASTKALNHSRLINILLFFCLSVIAASLISLYVKVNLNISDPREISVFISHIRFGLFISFSIFILLGFLVKNVYKSLLAKVSITLSIIWLVVFLFILKSLTGIIITGLLLVALFIVYSLKRKKLFIPTILLFSLLGFTFWHYISDIYKDVTVAKKVDFSQLEKLTPNGNPYVHDTAGYGIENGKYVGLYLSATELRNSWNNRSRLDYDGYDNKGQNLSHTLIRYLHSKGYRKDAEGVNKLSADEIRQIEDGVANANYLESFNIRARIEQVLQGYKSYRFDKNPNASSFMQRIEYWKTSVYIIKNKPVFGYGTGDIQNVFDQAYNETNSILLPEFRHRSHNQFFAIAIAFGLTGLLIFMFSLLYPAIYLRKFSNYYYFTFFIIAFISFLTEDTLETQAGVTFFAFFSALLLFGVRKEVDDNSRI